MIKLDNLQSKYLFYCDENFPEPSMRYLKRRGFKAVHSNDVGNNKNTDMRQFHYAKKHKSILITNDFDFVSFKEKGCNLQNTGIVILNSDYPTNTNKLIDILKKQIRNYMEISLQYPQREYSNANRILIWLLIRRNNHQKTPG